MTRLYHRSSDRYELCPQAKSDGLSKKYQLGLGDLRKEIKGKISKDNIEIKKILNTIDYYNSRNRYPLTHEIEGINKILFEQRKFLKTKLKRS